MNRLSLALLLLLFSAVSMVSTGQESPVLKMNVSVAPELKGSFMKGGRIILYLTRQPHKEPRNGFDIVVGVTPKEWDGTIEFLLDTRNKEVISAGEISKFLAASDPFTFQVIYKQNPDDGQENEPGNLVSDVGSASCATNTTLTLRLNKVIPPLEIVQHKFVKPVVMRSKCLSEFSGRPRQLRASVLATLGPKLQGKIWIWTGDMDGLFSNVATRFLQAYLSKTENPKSGARISFTAMAGHCQEWSDKAVVRMVAEKAAGR